MNGIPIWSFQQLWTLNFIKVFLPSTGYRKQYLDSYYLASSLPAAVAPTLLQIANNAPSIIDSVFDSFVGEEQLAEIPNRTVEQEISYFLSLPLFQMSTFNHQSFYIQERKEILIIANAKQKLDSLSATTVDVEHFFSVATFRYNKYSNTMSPEKLELKMLVKTNLANVFK